MNKLDFIGDLLLKWRIKVIRPYISGRLLDLGCGTNELVRSYKNGIGVDVHQFGDADLILEDTSKTPFKQNEFDTITIIAALNHIPNRMNVLIEMHRILKPNGSLIITNLHPKISYFWHKIRSPWDIDQTERGMKKGEVYGFSNNTLVELFAKTGFKLNKKKKFMLYLNNLYIFNKK